MLHQRGKHTASAVIIDGLVKRRKATFYGIIIIAMTIYFSGYLQAAQVYVTDMVKITLRTGPSMENKIIRMLPSGTPLNILQGEDNSTDKWIQVTTQDGQSGWVLKQYTMERIPAQTRLAGLEKRLQKTRADLQSSQLSLQTCQSENARLDKELEKISAQLQQTRDAYNKLKQDAANVFQLKKKYSQNVRELNKARTALDKLVIENKKLRSQSERNWFIAGAGVVGLSLLFGFILGRIQRKKAKRIYY